MLNITVKNSKTILSLLLKGDKHLKSKGIDQSRLNAESLLAHTLGISRERLYSRLEQRIAPRQIEHFWQLVIKRTQHIPLQYLIKKAEFWSITLKVDERALIPRSETELIIEEVMHHCSLKEPLIVDVGTGCGNIVLALAHELPKATCYATDISNQALELAKENAQRLGFEQQITFLQGDLLSPLKSKNLIGRIDFVVCNPPYIELKEYESLQPEVRLCEPKVSLLAPEEGMGIYRRLIKESERFLKKGGYLIVELGIDQLEKLKEIYNRYENWKIEAVREDLNGIPRTVSAQLL